MSVGVSRVQYHPVSLYRADAQWLVNHSGSTSDDYTRVSIGKDDLDEMVKRGRECEKKGCGCEFFDKDNKMGMGPATHKEITRNIKKRLLDIMTEAGADYLDLDISW
jgi:hypothetical protein